MNDCKLKFEPTLGNGQMVYLIPSCACGKWSTEGFWLGNAAGDKRVRKSWGSHVTNVLAGQQLGKLLLPKGNAV